MSAAAALSIEPLLLASEPDLFKLVLFVIFLLIGGLGKLFEVIAENKKRQRETERRAKREDSAQSQRTATSERSPAANRELRSGPMAQSELEERLRQMLGRDARIPQPNRAGSPTPPIVGQNAPRSAPPAASQSSVPTVTRAKKSKKSKQRGNPILETADGARRSRERPEASKRRVPSASAPIASAARDARSMLRGNRASVQQAFILTEILNRKHF